MAECRAAGGGPVGDALNINIKPRRSNDMALKDIARRHPESPRRATRSSAPTRATTTSGACGRTSRSRGRGAHPGVITQIHRARRAPNRSPTPHRALRRRGGTRQGQSPAAPTSWSRPLAGLARPRSTSLRRLGAQACTALGRWRSPGLPSALEPRGLSAPREDVSGQQTLQSRSAWWPPDTSAPA